MGLKGANCWQLVMNQIHQKGTKKNFLMNDCGKFHVNATSHKR